MYAKADIPIEDMSSSDVKESTRPIRALNRGLDVLIELNRPGAGSPGVRGTDLSAADQQALLATIGQFLSDNQRGARRVIDIIRARTGQ